MVLTQFCMVAQLDPTDWHIKKQKLLCKADNYIGRKNDIICYMLWTNNIAKRYEKWKFELYRFKVYLITLHTIRVRHSAAACTRLDKYMIFNCKSGSSPHCDCVQSITVEKEDAFLELKIFKNNCSTMLRMHFQPIKHYHMTIWTVIYWTSPHMSHVERKPILRFLLTHHYKTSFTVVPTKNDSDVVLCLQLLSQTPTYAHNLSPCESIDHLCINPILRIGLIHKWPTNSKSLITL